MHGRRALPDEDKTHEVQLAKRRRCGDVIRWGFVAIRHAVQGDGGADRSGDSVCHDCDSRVPAPPGEQGASNDSDDKVDDVHSPQHDASNDARAAEQGVLSLLEGCTGGVGADMGGSAWYSPPSSSTLLSSSERRLDRDSKGEGILLHRIDASNNFVADVLVAQDTAAASTHGVHNDHDVEAAGADDTAILDQQYEPAVVINLGPDDDADTHIFHIGSDVDVDEDGDEPDCVTQQTCTDTGDADHLGAAVPTALKQELREFLEMHRDGMRISWPSGWDPIRAQRSLGG